MEVGSSATRNVRDLTDVTEIDKNIRRKNENAVIAIISSAIYNVLTILSVVMEGISKKLEGRSKKVESRITKILVSTFCLLPQDEGLSLSDTFSDLDSSIG